MIAANLRSLQEQLPSSCTLVAVSKTKPVALIEEAYAAGHRDFGENKVQELVDKHDALPKDIHWHFIGHLQRNKVKYLAPFVHLIHGIDSVRLAQEIDKRAAQNDRVIDGLLQIHIAQEETKFGLGIEEVQELLESGAFQALTHLRIRGLMAMATLTDSEEQVRAEFHSLKQLFDRLSQNTEKYHLDSVAFTVLSMGMSGDYPLALQEGSNMIRIGTAIFGAR